MEQEKPIDKKGFEAFRQNFYRAADVGMVKHNAIGKDVYIKTIGDGVYFGKLKDIIEPDPGEITQLLMVVLTNVQEVECLNANISIHMLPDLAAGKLDLESYLVPVKNQLEGTLYSARVLSIAATQTSLV